MSLQIEPLLAVAVVVATALTDAVYVLFTNAVVRRHRLPAATWSSVWYLLSAIAVISYTNHWVYVLFAAMGSFHRRIRYHDLSASRPNLSAPACRLCASLNSGRSLLLNECPLRALSGPFKQPRRTSAIGGKADIQQSSPLNWEL
jgi:hypothetical protein